MSMGGDLELVANLSFKFDHFQFYVQWAPFEIYLVITSQTNEQQYMLCPFKTCSWRLFGVFELLILTSPTCEQQCYLNKALSVNNQ